MQNTIRKLAHAWSLPAAFACCSIAQAAPPQTPQPCQTSADLDALVNAMVPLAFQPGKRDQPNTLAPLRFGWDLWDTGEEQDGYQGFIEQFEHGSTHYQTVTQSPWTLYFHGPVFPFATSFAAQGPAGAIYTIAFPSAFQQTYSKFSTGTPDNDFADAFTTPGVKFFTAQNAVFSPRRELTGGAVLINDLTNLTTVLGPMAQQAGIEFVQNIGMASHPLIPTGEFDYNWLHPLITRVNFKPLLDTVPLGSLAPGAPGLVDPMAYPPLSMIQPDVAQLLSSSIESRVSAFLEEWSPYHIVGGEYFFGGSGVPNVDAETPCTGPIDATTYTDCLRVTDYSQASYEHFHRWLERKYDNLIGELNNAWLTGYAQFDNVDPLTVTGSTAATYQAAFDDWTAFQDEQYELESRAFQYNVAKSKRKTQAMYNWCGSPREMELAALHSDGIASGAWYVTNEGRLELPSQMKRTALHGLTYGTSLNFPLFGMPRGQDALGPCTPGSPPGVPPTFAPPCFDDVFSYRTLREFLTLGVDSLALGYWEAATEWTAKGGEGYALTSAMNVEVQGLRARRAFMTPWRSPLLVHTDAVESTDLERKTFDLLVQRQVQLTAFSEEQALDDLWVRSNKQILLSTFASSLTLDEAVALRKAAHDRDWTALILADLAKYNELVMAGFGFGAGMLHATYGTVTIDAYDMPLAGSTSTKTHWMVVFQGPPNDILALLRGSLVASLEAYVTPQWSLRPVRAIVTSGSDPSPNDPTTLDLNVTSDGINFLVSVANVSTSTQSVKLFPLVPPDGPVCQYVFPDGAQFTLDSGAAAVRYIRAELTGIDGFPASQFTTAVSTAVQSVNALGLMNPPYDTKAALTLLSQLQLLSTSTEREKIVAGLARLKRMVFLRYAPAAQRLSAVRLDGATKVVNAPVQLEFLLQYHLPVEQGLTHPTAGVLAIDPTQPLEPQVWNFAAQPNGAYQLPALNLVEAHIQDPQYGSHAALLLP